MLDGAKRGDPGVLVPAEAVVEDRLGPIEHGEADAFAAIGQLGSAAIDERGRLGPAASQGEEPTAPYGAPGVRRLGRGLDLVDERRRRRSARPRRGAT